MNTVSSVFRLPLRGRILVKVVDPRSVLLLRGKTGTVCTFVCLF